MIRVLSFAVTARILTLVLSETAILYACYFFAVYVDPDIADISSFVQFDSGVARVGSGSALGEQGSAYPVQASARRPRTQADLSFSPMMAGHGIYHAPFVL